MLSRNFRERYMYLFIIGIKHFIKIFFNNSLKVDILQYPINRPNLPHYE